MTTIFLTIHEWEILKDKVFKDHPPSVKLLSRRQREVLGFVVRYYTNHDKPVCLDFYDEARLTMFRLQYL